LILEVAIRCMESRNLARFSQNASRHGRSDDLKAKVRNLPDGPGVYLMKDRLGRIIYVGKANSLRKRVSSYFQPGRDRARPPAQDQAR
jgi:hypothetical protein